MSLKNINYLVKISLFGLLTHAALYSHLPQYQNKAVPQRLMFYPIAAAMVCLAWGLVCRSKGKRLPYPYLVDIMITFVVAFDLFGNTVGFYDSLPWWDDMMHGVLSVPWVLVFGLMIIGKKYSSKWLVFGLVMAYGSTSHIVWELLEYVSFVRTHPVESLSAYRDTMGDLTMSLAGTLLGAWLTAKIYANKHK